MTAEQTTYRYDGDRLVAEEDATGTIATYLYADGESAPVAMKHRNSDGSYANYFFVANPHGDVVAVTDAGGAVVNQYAYGPWGEAVRISEQVHQPFRYASYYFDDTTGLYWLGSRHYEPATGRFLSRDSADPDIRDVKSLNSYAYADDAPATHIDPAGTSPVKPRSSGPWKPKVGPPKPKPQPFKPQQMGAGGGGGTNNAGAEWAMWGCAVGAIAASAGSALTAGVAVTASNPVGWVIAAVALAVVAVAMFYCEYRMAEQWVAGVKPRGRTNYDTAAGLAADLARYG